MNLLFIHQNFPGQYKHIVPHMASNGHRVVCMGDEKNVNRQLSMERVHIMPYQMPKNPDIRSHPYLRSLEASLRRGSAVARLCHQLRRKHRFVPDVICVHPGWGEGLFVKDVFPDAKVLAFLEFFYRARGSDVGFDPEFPSGPKQAFRIRMKNATLLLSLDAADWGLTPTRWQLEQHPAAYRPRISVIHDGIDTQHIKPDSSATLEIPGTDLKLKAGDEVVTYVSRNLEPYRGFHTFMRAVPLIQKRRPNARILIIGGDKVSYGKPPPAGTTYRKQYLAEVADKTDLDRVHFLGRMPYNKFLTMLQISACHVYLTYPFVLSWSMLEAMASGCALVGSATPPVQEVIKDGENGLLVDFFSPEAVADGVDRVLSHPDRMADMRENARATVVRDFDLQSVCLPRQVKLIEDLAAGTLEEAK